MYARGREKEEFICEFSLTYDIKQLAIINYTAHVLKKTNRQFEVKCQIGHIVYPYTRNVIGDGQSMLS